MVQKIETISIGGGQAGLATSYYLKQHNHEHVVLEQAAQPGNAWRNDRWDSFVLITPNWTFQLPGAHYGDDDPNGYMPRAEIVKCFENYVDQFNLPVQFNTHVNSVEKNGDQGGYVVKTEDFTWHANNVVIATGLYQQHKVPQFSTNISGKVAQFHSGQYHNPDMLAPGAVLVVGSAQTGCQIAEELYQSGRKVYLCVGGAGRAPRRYRGKDIVEWLDLVNFFDKTVDELESPKAKFDANPHLTGKNGGHNINLHQFARDGVTLLGRMMGASEGMIHLAPDLTENLAKADQFESEIVKFIDDYIAENGMEAPEEDLPVLRDGYDAPVISELDLVSAGITSTVWAIGYKFDFSMVKFPVFDSDGYPIQKRGVTEYPGLYFVGLPFLYKRKSGLLAGVGEDAEFISQKIVGRV